LFCFLNYTTDGAICQALFWDLALCKLHKDFAFNLFEIGYIAEKRGATTDGATLKKLPTI